MHVPARVRPAIGGGCRQGDGHARRCREQQRGAWQEHSPRVSRHNRPFIYRVIYRHRQCAPVGHTFHRAGTFALTPTLVPATDLTRLNSWFSACQQGGQLVGLSATGLIVAQWGAPAAFFINGVTFLVSAATLVAISSSWIAAAAQPPAPAPSFWRGLLGSWSDFGQVMQRDVRLAGLVVVSTADNVAAILFNLILAPLVWERLAASPAWLSLIAGGFAFG